MMYMLFVSSILLNNSYGLPVLTMDPKYRNDVYGGNLINLPYLITHMAYLCSQRTPNVQIKYFMFGW
jgi:hypothetical protein